MRNRGPSIAQWIHWPPTLGFAELPDHNVLGGIQSLLLGANMRRSRGPLFFALAFTLIGGASLGVSGTAAADPSPTSSQSQPTTPAQVTAAPTDPVTTSASPPTNAVKLPTFLGGFAATLNPDWRVS